MQDDECRGPLEEKYDRPTDHTSYIIGIQLVSAPTIGSEKLAGPPMLIEHLLRSTIPFARDPHLTLHFRTATQT